MHSKLKIWEFFDQFNKGIISIPENKISLISCYTQELEFFVKKFIKSKLSLQSVDSSLVDLEWFEVNLCSMSLFEDQNMFYVDRANLLPKSVIEFLAENNNELVKTIVLQFSGASNSITKLKKSKDINVIDIVEHPFWEHEKLISFLAREKSIFLKYDLVEFIEQNIEPSFINYDQVLEKIKAEVGEKPLITDLKNIIQPNKIDNFYFADLLAQKRRKEFYQKIIELSPSFEEIRKLFVFLQTHMIKISSPQSIANKNRLSKYDKKILDQSKYWNAEDIARVLAYLKKVEHLAKVKSPFLYSEFRSTYLISL